MSAVQCATDVISYWSLIRQLKTFVRGACNQVNQLTPLPQDVLFLIELFLGAYHAAILSHAANTPFHQVSNCIQFLGVSPFQKTGHNFPVYDH